MALSRMATIDDTNSPYFTLAQILSALALLGILLSFSLPGWILEPPSGEFTGFWFTCSNWNNCTWSYLTYSRPLNAWWMSSAGLHGFSILLLMHAFGLSIRLPRDPVRVPLLKNMFSIVSLTAALIIGAGIVTVLLNDRTLHEKEQKLYYCVYLSLAAVVMVVMAAMVLSLHTSPLPTPKKMSMPPGLAVHTIESLRQSISIQPTAKSDETEWKKKQYF